MMTTMRFSDIIEDVNFRAICVPIRVAMNARGVWLQRRQYIPFWNLYRALEKATVSYSAQMEVYVPALTAMLSNIAKVMPALAINQDTFDGYLRLIDTYGAVVPPMMLAYASASERFATPAQVADATGTSESLWRNRSAANEIPGAVKMGKQWLLPRDVLRLLYGIELPADLYTLTPEEQAAEQEARREAEQEAQAERAHEARSARSAAVADDEPLTDEEWERARRRVARFDHTDVEQN